MKTACPCAMNRRFDVRRPATMCLLLAAFLAVGHVVRASNVPEWSMAVRLYRDVKARRIGDIVTVIIDESSTMNRAAQHDAGKQTSGGGSASFGAPVLTAQGEERPNRWDNVSLPEFGWQLQHQFSGGGQMTSQDDFQSTMSARVLDVLPNGSLLLEGKRTVHLQNEKIEVILTGLVRPRDINSDNTVSSSRIADASIRYETDGPISRDQRRGLVTRLINWLNIF